MGTIVRRATPDDAKELTRLREIMLEVIAPGAGPSWKEDCTDAFGTALADADGPLQAFVADDPGRPGRLAACSVGVIQAHLPSPHNPSGMSGYILNVATDPAHRRQGHARAVVTATLDWMRDRGIERVDVHASEQAEALYRDLGFHEPRNLALTAWLTH
jgi:ribosomal protein S18 acetylase RimI-like enzyme